MEVDIALCMIRNDAKLVGSLMNTSVWWSPDELTSFYMAISSLQRISSLLKGDIHDQEGSSDAWKDAWNTCKYVGSIKSRFKDRPTEIGENSNVYFAKSSKGLVKIGYSGDIKQRMLAVAHENPRISLEVVAIVPGGIKEERALHKHFSHISVDDSLHTGREWFMSTTELEDYYQGIASNRPRKPPRPKGEYSGRRIEQLAREILRGRYAKFI